MAAPTSPHVAAATQSPLPATAATEAAPSEERSGEVAALSAGRTLQNAPADYLASGVAEGAPVAAEPAAPPAGEPSERAATADAPLSPTAASGTSTQGVRAELMRQPTTVTAPSPAAGAAAAPAASTSSKARRASKSAAGQARRTPPSDAAASPRQQQFAALEAAAVAAPHDQQHRGGPKPVKDADYEWVHELTTTDRFFKPCPNCSATHGGRDVLVTYLDMTDPKPPGVCQFCLQPRLNRGHRMLQVRRSTYHDVVKISEISRLLDISAVQPYVINQAKVVFLKPRPQPRSPKGLVMPARCVVDGRQLMDVGNTYCCLRCKLEVEAPEMFTEAELAHEDLGPMTTAAASRPPAALPRNHEAQYYSAAGRGRSVSREAAAGVSGEPVAADGMAAAAGGGTLPPRRRQPKKRTYSPGGVSEGVAAVGEEPEGEARLETSAQRAPRPAGASPLRRRVATSGASARRRRAAAAAVPAAVGAPAASNTLLAAAADMLAAGFAGKPLAPGAAELLEDFAAAGAESGGGGGGQAMAPEVVLPLWGARAKRYKPARQEEWQQQLQLRQQKAQQLPEEVAEGGAAPPLPAATAAEEQPTISETQQSSLPTDIKGGRRRRAATIEAATSAGGGGGTSALMQRAAQQVARRLSETVVGPLPGPPWPGLVRVATAEAPSAPAPQPGGGVEGGPPLSAYEYPWPGGSGGGAAAAAAPYDEPDTVSSGDSGRGSQRSTSSLRRKQGVPRRAPLE